MASERTWAPGSGIGRSLQLFEDQTAVQLRLQKIWVASQGPVNRLECTVKIAQSEQGHRQIEQGCRIVRLHPRRPPIKLGSLGEILRLRGLKAEKLQGGRMLGSKRQQFAKARDRGIVIA